MAKTVGLSDAERKMLLTGEGSLATQKRLQEKGLLVELPPTALSHCPRTAAALAAPRMTEKEFQMLLRVENRQAALLSLHPSQIAIRNSEHMCKWLAGSVPSRLTPSGLTALNNVRAAMPGKWEELK